MDSLVCEGGATGITENSDAQKLHVENGGTLGRGTRAEDRYSSNPLSVSRCRENRSGW